MLNYGIYDTPSAPAGSIDDDYRWSGDRYGPATRQRLRGVNSTLMIGVRFVGKVASRSELCNGSTTFRTKLWGARTDVTHVSDESVSSLFASADENPLTIAPFCCLLGSPPAPLTSQHLIVQSALPLTSREDSALKASE